VVAVSPDVADPAAWSIEELLAAKARLGVRICVVIPARDEEDTVATVVRTVIRAWMEQTSLVDEVIVIDSDSIDDTAARARDAGAIVHAAADIRPDLGRAEGKGEALWKSLFVATGDLLVFLDSDLVQWGPHFVPGLLGPLLLRPEIELVKAVYHRPHLDASGAEIEAGGRVTELVARPLLALHVPELTGIVQPLSGEWAIRRNAFEQMAVPVGYGVEVAALIDTCLVHGIDAIAQVDLGRRAHRHHRHDTLGPMSVQVMAAVERRLDMRRGVDAQTITLRQFDPVAGGFTARVRQVPVLERPPAVTVPRYRGRP